MDNAVKLVSSITCIKRPVFSTQQRFSLTPVSKEPAHKDHYKRKTTYLNKSVHIDPLLIKYSFLFFLKWALYTGHPVLDFKL